jgi:hypothetical protein
MMLRGHWSILVAVALVPLVSCFIGQLPTFLRQTVSSPPPSQAASPFFAKREQSVTLDSTLTDEKVASLFAWIAKAFSGDMRYNNLMIAIAAVFGELDDNHELRKMVEEARETLPAEEELIGDPLLLSEREQASLGAMGAWVSRYYAYCCVDLLTWKNSSYNIYSNGNQEVFTRLDPILFWN